jgi:hypothetical protein
MTYHDPEHSDQEDRFITFGTTAAGRLVAVVHADRSDRIRIISARNMTRRERKQYEEPAPHEADDIRDEYDLARLGWGVQGKYFDRYREGTNLARLDKEVQEAFPTDEAVNEALREVLRSRSA